MLLWRNEARVTKWKSINWVDINLLEKKKIKKKKKKKKEYLLTNQQKIYFFYFNQIQKRQRCKSIEARMNAAIQLEWLQIKKEVELKSTQSSYNIININN